MDRRHAADRRHRGGAKDRQHDRQISVQEREIGGAENPTRLLQAEGDVDTGPGQAGLRQHRGAAGLHRSRRSVRREEAVRSPGDRGPELRRRVHRPDGERVLGFAR